MQMRQERDLIQYVCNTFQLRSKFSENVLYLYVIITILIHIDKTIVYLIFISFINDYSSTLLSFKNRNLFY